MATQLEKNITHSFQLVKKDMDKLANAFEKLYSQTQIIAARLDALEQALKPKPARSYVIAAQPATKPAKKRRIVKRRVVKRRAPVKRKKKVVRTHRACRSPGSRSPP